MVIKKGDNIVFDAPNWLILFGIRCMADAVVGVAKAVCSRKKR